MLLSCKNELNVKAGLVLAECRQLKMGTGLCYVILTRCSLSMAVERDRDAAVRHAVLHFPCWKMCH